MKWPPSDEVDGETAYLVDLAEKERNGYWPGWDCIAALLNAKYRNNRSPSACRNKYKRYVHQKVHDWIEQGGP